ncbi:MAG: hypothetical protein ACYC8T_20095 [Myxococcaceae bacterium]
MRVGWTTAASLAREFAARSGLDASVERLDGAADGYVATFTVTDGATKRHRQALIDATTGEIHWLDVSRSP